MNLNVKKPAKPETVALMTMNRERLVGLDGAIPWDIAAYRAYIEEVTVKQIVITTLAGYDALGAKPFEAARAHIVVDSGYVAAMDKRPELVNSWVAASYADVHGFVYKTFLRRWILGGPTLVARANYWIDKIQLLVVDAPVPEDVPGVRHYMPLFESMYDAQGEQDLGFGRLLTFSKKAGENSLAS